MYRILVADDEGIMLEAFKSVISSTFGDSCITETAKTGRAVTEKAETFHPDIVFMDIHMPGINGIQAMREIRKFNTTALFYVVSAYDKFDYAKEAIDLGVERYLTKPISKAKIISAVEEAIEKVDKKRNQRSNLLKIQEKLETVIPVVENSFVGSLLFQQEEQTADYYRQLLDIEEKQGYVMVIQFGQSYENGRLISPVGMNVKAQSFYDELRDVAMACSGYEELRSWFLDKMVNICRSIRDQKEEQSNSAVKKAMLYIQENFSKDISLDEVSGQVNISPYYFSKIFKEETGENFIEYLTRIRIEKAKEFLKQPEVSVKEAGVKSGYTDPNYFSRIFKKQTDMTPSEFKTRYGK